MTLSSNSVEEVRAEYSLTPKKICKSDIYLALIALVLCSSMASRLKSFDLVSFFTTLINTNLFLLFAFFVLITLCRTEQDNRQAQLLDYAGFAIAALGLYVFGKLGTTHDVGLITGGLAAWFWVRRKTFAHSQFIALVWFALTLNILIAPLLFQFFKSFILVSEVELVAYIWNSMGYNVQVDGQLLSTPSGMRLRMVGACSVFTNLSFGFLCYASVKACNKSPMSFGDVISVAILIALLALGNTVRIGLMLPSFSAYEFWHHGNGASIFGAIQFSIIVAISFLSLILWKRI